MVRVKPWVPSWSPVRDPWWQSHSPSCVTGSLTFLVWKAYKLLLHSLSFSPACDLGYLVHSLTRLSRRHRAGCPGALNGVGRA